MSSSQDPILTISVAANILKLHPRTLMLYEKEGLLKPHRTDTKRRLFSIKNVQDLQFIKYLTQVQGINLKGAKILLQAIDKAEMEGVKMKKFLFPSFRPAKLI